MSSDNIGLRIEGLVRDWSSNERELKQILRRLLVPKPLDPVDSALKVAVIFRDHIRLGIGPRGEHTGDDTPLRTFDIFRDAERKLKRIRALLATSGVIKTFKSNLKRELLEIRSNKTATDTFFGVFYLFAHALRRSLEEPQPSHDANSLERRQKWTCPIPPNHPLAEKLQKWTPLLEEGVYPPFEPGTGEFDDWFFNQGWDAIDEVQRYHDREKRVSTIFVSQAGTPPALERNLRRLRNCYKYGLTDVAVVFCRSILEASFSKYLAGRGRLSGKGRPPLSPRDEWRFQELVSKLPRDALPLRLKKRAKEIGHIAGKILHRSTPTDLDDDEALRIIQDTFQIVEELFG